MALLVPVQMLVDSTFECVVWQKTQLVGPRLGWEHKLQMVVVKPDPRESGMSLRGNMLVPNKFLRKDTPEHADA